ncbi:hypothetical protein [Legionella jordanis]|uniref:Uncharacterized protein n=1 Tax=Legionella jordanis TaxID=456 RepID=A0A0W0VDL4_9GAMM|nr:hypothetical protein [Legionella jordanis]KTD17721.1 hypothetical protein Ljor_2027 [Legionella jordanis]VEH11345.1 Uncharacterised protein [Legionella jordanis]
MKIKTGDYFGSSETGINEAVQQALQNVPEHSLIEIIETRSSWTENKRYYQVIISAFAN